MKTEQPLWGRGQMVSPQHFQQQAAYAAWSAECIARLGLAQPWGMIEATFEPDALKLGRLQARHLHIRFPDGTLIDTDNADDLPLVLSLESESQEVTVVLALPLLRANGGNCLKPDEVAERPVRFRQRWRDVRNTFGDDTRQIAVMQPELTLRFAHQNNSDYLTCPVAHLQQDSQGNWALDEAFLPPLLALQGSRWLVTQLDQLMMQLRARLTRLMAMRRESNERMADFAVADVSLFWLLNALNSAEPVLGLFQRHPQTPPERLYPELARLAGSLLTFSLEHQVSAIPAWQHEQLNNVFPPLFDLLGDLLEASLPSRVVSIELDYDPRLHFWHLDFTAREALNTDARESNSLSESVVVRVYQLKDRKTFDKTVYQQLLKDGDTILKADLLASRDVVVKPGGDANLNMPMEEDAQFVAVAGLFRHPDMVNNTWKQVIERDDLDPDKPRILEAGNNHLTLQPLKDD